MTNNYKNVPLIAVVKVYKQMFFFISYGEVMDMKSRQENYDEPSIRIAWGKNHIKNKLFFVCVFSLPFV